VTERGLHEAGRLGLLEPERVERATVDAEIDCDLATDVGAREHARLILALRTRHAFVEVAESDRREIGSDGELHLGASNYFGGDDAEFRAEEDILLYEIEANAVVELLDVEQSLVTHGDVWLLLF